MKKWITDIVQEQTYDATRQAKFDIATIGQSMGYRVVNLFRYNDLKESNQAVRSRIDGITEAIAAGDLLVYQYPSLNSGRFENFFVDRMHQRHVKFVCLVHDVETLRDQRPPKWIDEVAYFNKCDVLIVHNHRMAAKLREMGVTTPMVYQYLLDYLDDNHEPDRYVATPEDFQRGVVLAGNLMKSRYIAHWDHATPITAFGNASPEVQEEFEANPQVDYQGKFYRWELIQRLPRTFGLAWDGDTSIYRYDDYTRYNHPHKVSMYLSHGLPVIVWRDAAVAKLIVTNGLGIAIDSLADIDAAIQEISDRELAQMLANVNAFGYLIRDGWFTRQGLQAAEQKIISPHFEVPQDD
ncbi:sugar transferase [Levilactobacillus zymae]|uniref:Nucleotide sugar synthetase-like protein n=1 Tax=Levilactobacillus zymae TaxID=267363 RepID=A0A1Y6JWS2_9LACO|nr:sugar transferase [Levilactobacillus zymae]SMS13283.1 Nucleotide sugar synthetase-like protein [Levilactobacillus zymae]